MANIIVSSCLLGCNCRYDGKNCLNKDVRILSKKHTLIPICPEQMGGLSTPRSPSEIVNTKVISKNGNDVTNQYNKGALMALKIAKVNNCSYALLKTKSPSCGKGKIYDGSFSGKLIEGDGITVKLFKENNIKVFSDLELNELQKELYEQK